MVLGAAAVHELGHWAALRLLGARALTLRVSALGAVMTTDGRLSYGGELLAVLAGPAANLLSAVGLTALGPEWETAVGAHLILGIFNLLPVRPLDGGRALELAVSWRWDPEAGDRIARWTGAVAALALAVCLEEVMRRTGGSLWLLPALAGLLVAAGREVFAN